MARLQPRAAFLRERQMQAFINAVEALRGK
jgi:hypothetical protein